MSEISREQEVCSCGSKLYWRTRQSKYCYTCSQEFEIDDQKSAIDHLNEEFHAGLKFGTQYDAIQSANKLVADEFAYAPDFGEIENPEFEQHCAEFEKKFDEYHASRRVKFPISQQCKNALAAIRKQYQSVKIIKIVTDKLNSLERQLVWATWKGYAHTVYYPKG